MLSGPLDQSTDLGNGCCTRAHLLGNEVRRLPGSECVLLGRLRVGACPDLNYGSARGGSIGYIMTVQNVVYALYKFVYSFKVVKLFLKHPM
jgi:hypothetical protein